MKVFLPVALTLTVLFSEASSFPLKFYGDNLADRILQDLSSLIPPMPFFPKTFQKRIHVKFIPNRIFINQIPSFQEKEHSRSRKHQCSRRQHSERQSLPIPILPKFSLVAAQYGSQNFYPLGLLPTGEALSNFWTWVDDVQVRGQTRKLVIAGLDRSTPSDFEALCIARKEEPLQKDDAVLPFTFPPVMSSEGFLNEHNSYLVSVRSNHLHSRRCLGFSSDHDIVSYPQLPMPSHVGQEIPYSEPQNENVNSSYDFPLNSWTYEETHNEVPMSGQPVPEVKLPSSGFPSPPGHQLSLVNPSVYKSYGRSTSINLIGLIPRYEMPFLSGFLELSNANFAPDKANIDLEAADFFRELWSGYSLAARVDTGASYPPSFKFIVLFREENGTELRALNATTWPIHVQLDGQPAEYQLAHVPDFTYGSHEMLDNLYLLLAAVPEPSVQPSADSNLEVPAYPGMQPRLIQDDDNSSTTTETSISNDEATPKRTGDKEVKPPKPLPSKKSWKNRVSRPNEDNEINRVARQILAFLSTEIEMNQNV